MIKFIIVIGRNIFLITSRKAITKLLTAFFKKKHLKEKTVANLSKHRNDFFIKNLKVKIIII